MTPGMLLGEIIWVYRLYALRMKTDRSRKRLNNDTAQQAWQKQPSW